MTQSLKFNLTLFINSRNPTLQKLILDENNFEHGDFSEAALEMTEAPSREVLNHLRTNKSMGAQILMARFGTSDEDLKVTSEDKRQTVLNILLVNPHLAGKNQERVLRRALFYKEPSLDRLFLCRFIQKIEPALIRRMLETLRLPKDFDKALVALETLTYAFQDMEMPEEVVAQYQKLGWETLFYWDDSKAGSWNRYGSNFVNTSHVQKLLSMAGDLQSLQQNLDTLSDRKFLMILKSLLIGHEIFILPRITETNDYKSLSRDDLISFLREQVEKRNIGIEEIENQIPHSPTVNAILLSIYYPDRQLAAAEGGEVSKKLLLEMGLESSEYLEGLEEEYAKLLPSLIDGVHGVQLSFNLFLQFVVKGKLARDIPQEDLEGLFLKVIRGDGYALSSWYEQTDAVRPLNLDTVVSILKKKYNDKNDSWAHELLRFCGNAKSLTQEEIDTLAKLIPFPSILKYGTAYPQNKVIIAALRCAENLLGEDRASWEMFKNLCMDLDMPVDKVCALVSLSRENPLVSQNSAVSKI